MTYHQHQHDHRLLSRHPAGSRSGSAFGRFCWASLLHSLGLQMLSLFILFYLYQQGWPLTVTVVYLLVFILLHPFCNRLAAQSILKHDVAKTMLLANILRFLFTAALFGLGQPTGFNYGLLGLVVVLDALSVRIHATAWSFHFASIKTRGQSGRQIGLVWALSALTGVLAPLAGGLLAQVWGFRISLVVAGILLLVSVIPLISAKSTGGSDDLQRLRRALSLRQCWRLFGATPKGGLWAFAGSTAVLHVLLPLWSVYLAIVVFADRAYEGLGLLAAVSAVIALSVSLGTGWLVDRGRQRGVMLVSACLELLLGGLRFFVASVPMAVVHNLAHQQSSAHSLVVFQWYYDQEDERVRRLAFFQMCSYFQAICHLVFLAILVACLFIFADNQLEVIKYACIALGFAGLLIPGLSLKPGLPALKAN